MAATGELAKSDFVARSPTIATTMSRRAASDRFLSTAI
jgi:hypothetical protein